MELKVVCQCGQKFKFDVEPVNGRMPFTVTCPLCNADGTATANGMIAEIIANQPPPLATAPPPTPIVPAASGLRIHREAHPEPAAVAAPEASGSEVATPAPIRPTRPMAAAAAPQPEKKPSFAMGMLGGLVGALVGALVYFLIFKYSGYQIKLLAIGVGALAGCLAEYLGKGEGSKELGGITAVFVLAGLIGAQYFVTLGWWHESTEKELKEAAALYETTVNEAKEVVKVVPHGSDAEIRLYLVKLAAKDGDTITPGKISDEDVKFFREHELPEYQGLASGQITKPQFEQKHELKTSLTQEEKQEDEGTFKAFFLLFLLSKLNLFSLAGAAGLAFKMSTNA
jgi:hypothetical protein